jgi:hypothetical protein
MHIELKNKDFIEGDPGKITWDEEFEETDYDYLYNAWTPDGSPAYCKYKLIEKSGITFQFPVNCAVKIIAVKK